MWKTAVLGFLFTVCFLTPMNCIDSSVKGDKCFSLDLCSRSGIGAFRTCSCEEDCDKYATCCTDALNYQAPSHKQEYHCYNDKVVSTPVFAKRACADEFSAHSSHRVACLEEEPDARDHLGNLLVTSFKTMTTYWNRDCALCNEEQRSDLVAWTVQVTCPKAYHESLITYKQMKSNLTFDWDVEKWGILIGDDFVKCSISIFQPAWATGKLKYCAPNMISTCPPNHTDAEMVKRCFLYHGERKLKDRDVYYKNVHCALCNGVSLKDLDCVGRNYAPKSPNKGDKVEFVKAVFQDWEWAQLLGSDRYRCSENFGYDPFWDKCRKVERLQGQQTAYEKNAARSISANLLILLFLFIVNKLLL